MGSALPKRAGLAGLGTEWLWGRLSFGFSLFSSTEVPFCARDFVPRNTFVDTTVPLENT
jgi:hypothetical protein